MYINSYFMLLFDLRTDWDDSEDYKSHLENANIRIELKFNKPLPVAITCLLYLEYDKSLLLYISRNVTTDF